MQIFFCSRSGPTPLILLCLRHPLESRFEHVASAANTIATSSELPNFFSSWGLTTTPQCLHRRLKRCAATSSTFDGLSLLTDTHNSYLCLFACTSTFLFTRFPFMSTELLCFLFVSMRVLVSSLCVYGFIHVSASCFRCHLRVFPVVLDVPRLLPPYIPASCHLSINYTRTLSPGGPTTPV